VPAEHWEQPELLVPGLVGRPAEPAEHTAHWLDREEAVLIVVVPVGQLEHVAEPALAYVPRTQAEQPVAPAPVPVTVPA